MIDFRTSLRFLRSRRSGIISFCFIDLASLKAVSVVRGPPIVSRRILTSPSFPLYIIFAVSTKPRPLALSETRRTSCRSSAPPSQTNTFPLQDPNRPQHTLECIRSEGSDRRKERLPSPCSTTHKIESSTVFDTFPPSSSNHDHHRDLSPALPAMGFLFGGFDEFQTPRLPPSTIPLPYLVFTLLSLVSLLAPLVLAAFSRDSSHPVLVNLLVSFFIYLLASGLV